MSWHFSQALVEAYSEASCLDGEQSAPWNMNPMQQLYSQSDKMMEFCNRSQSGMTCEHLTENHGKELLTWFLEGFPVRTSAAPEEVKGSVENVLDCGQKWHASFAKYDQDMCLWKIARSSLFEDLTSFLGTWPRWGMMQNGECWAVPMLEPDINDLEFGFWPTVTKTEIDSTGSRELIGTSEVDQKGRRWGTSLTTLIRSKSISKIGKLNPVFAELWMGWPLGWTELQELEMDKFQQWLDSHGKSSDQIQAKQNHRKIPKKSFKKSSQKGLFD